ncbi:WD40 repeat-like protein [Vararia minispora EC-137]|uniref:WD40 repeat-like protein n=1 Tax=Vararia minispora EC-137 TaxID=1314806 RepID=A0ACB8QUH5_9AGAM|nr:WD40 repeat-like protein [Vararia minispora EC-137]
MPVGKAVNDRLSQVQVIHPKPGSNVLAVSRSLAMAESELVSPPLDSISAVRFAPTEPNTLLVSSWDKTVRLYDAATNAQKSKYEHRAAVLSTTFSDDAHAFSGGLDATLRELDLASENMRALGQHSDTISAVSWLKNTNSLATGSWDRTLRVWDPRASTAQQSSYDLPERVYFMDSLQNRLVVALASRLFHIYDVRNMSQPEQTRESNLKFMTRALACMIDGQGARFVISGPWYATASVEGRIAVEYFDMTPEVQDKKYAFKCHRQTIDDVDHVWPVNSLAFHPIYNTFASAGSDGTVSIWDLKLKKRLRQYPKYSGPVPSIAFNADGSKLAVGVSYTWDNGEEGAQSAPRPTIHIRSLGDEIKPKNWSG